MINALEKHIVESIKNLEENEIQAAVDLSDWLIHTQAELEYLNAEEKSNVVIIDTLTINIVGAKSREDRVWAIYFDSAATLNDALAKRLQIRAAYMVEKRRRLEENIVLDGVIELFIKQVSILAKKTRARVDDVADDGKLNRSTGTDYTEDHVDRIEGSVKSSIASASAVTRS